MFLLLVEDDIDLGNVLKQFLSMQAFRVTLARTGEEGFRYFNDSRPDLCIFDIMLPGMDGLSLGKKIKEKHPDQLMIFLTARSAQEDILKGLKLGADDYICKPFEPEELVLRIRNLLKRAGRSETESIPVGNFRFLFERMYLHGYGKEFRLTLKESELLRYFISHKNQVLKREDILVNLWGENDYFMGRSLDVFISRLRKYLKPEKSVQLETLRGIGYLFRVKK